MYCTTVCRMRDSVTEAIAHSVGCFPSSFLGLSNSSHHSIPFRFDACVQLRQQAIKSGPPSRRLLFRFECYCTLPT